MEREPQTAYLQPVLPPIPLQRRRKEFYIYVHVFEPSVLFVVATEHNLVLPSHVDANTVIRE